MSRYFVTDAPVAIPEWEDDTSIISDRKPNVIAIKAKMDVATKGKVTSELFTMGKAGDLEARLGANETALLIHNIVSWSGPDFDGVPCDAAHIRTLDPTEPHIAKVLEEIAIRNKAPSGPKERAATSTSTSAGATDLITPAPSEGARSGNGQSKSPLVSAYIGHLKKSEDSTPIS